MITIIDYGVGNLMSIKNMLNRQGVPSQISRSQKEIKESGKLILPGVGSFDAAMKGLAKYELHDVINDHVKDGKYLLGICLGAQLLMRSSEEGVERGLGLIGGECKRFINEQIFPLRVPHVGWEEVIFKKDHPLALNEGAARFYFTHSYYLKCDNPQDELATSSYGHEFCCAVCRDNIFGVQFHPEKSHRYGAQFLLNFASM
jgi:imidazole glycerol-phosphate synthase subunit HisH